jgi:NAD(P)H dehydrogenase (quinone)
MHCYIVYAHPSRESFTAKVLDEFVRGLTAANHTFEIADLYKLQFNPVMDLAQYEHEVRIADRNVPADVRREHENIQRADVLVFIYPNWWSDCPAILKGWFDKVWSYGFAYEYVADKRLCRIRPKRALVICTAGYTNEALESNGIGPSMKNIMIKDRLKNQCFDHIAFEFLGGMSVGRTDFRETNLRKAFELGKELTAVWGANVQ